MKLMKTHRDYRARAKIWISLTKYIPLSNFEGWAFKNYYTSGRSNTQKSLARNYDSKQS